MADEVGSLPWWIRKLEKQLNATLAAKQLYDEYYEGNHRLQFATPKFRSAFGSLFSAFADNWCDLVVDAVEERLNIEGFRLGGNDVAGNRKAWDIWQANQLDADSQIAHTEALIHGESHLLVWAGEDERYPSITVESPLQVAVANVPGSRRKRAAAIKRWCDDEGFELLTLYLPDEIYKFRSVRKLTSGGPSDNPRRWVERVVDNEPWPLPNPLGTVPMVPLVNRPRLLHSGQSEIKRVIPLQDAVNKMVTDMLVASEFGAAPQRWATGMELPKDPETGKPLETFEHLINRVWTSSKPESRFGQFTQTDLNVFVSAIEMLVQHIASQTRTPPHYFALTGQFPSGDSIKSAETGLVAKVRRKMRHLGEGWEEGMSIGFAVIGDQKRASVRGAEIAWADPESRSEAQHIDAVVKQKILGVPRQMLWRQAGYSPTEIDEMLEMLKTEPPMDEPVVPPTISETVRA